jgi:cyclin-Q
MAHFYFQLIAGSCIFLAGKAHDEPLKVRDVINVTHRTLHKDTQPIELDEDYWRMRDALVQAELLIMRMLKFSILWSHPHKVHIK